MKPGYSFKAILIRGVWAAVFICAISGCGGSDKRPMYVKVTIDTSPESGAFVLMDGYDRGTTPVEISDIEPGGYEVVLHQDRYKRKIAAINVTQEPVQSFTVEMEPLLGSFSVTSNPPEAEVFLNGEPIGKTPILKKVLQVGPYTYEIKHPDYYPVTSDIVMEENFNLLYNHDLRPIEAKLIVLSRPSSANIWLNNIYQPRTTPAELVLRPGRYLVSVHTDGYMQADEMIVLEPNQTQTVQLEMQPGNVPQGMVLIPAGKFTMGANEQAPAERPAREVELKAFYIDRFEVTNQAYKKFSAGHKYIEGQDNYPAMGISWTEAGRYCASLGKRLPTEAEWEKAARGTDARAYPWGDIFSPQMSNTVEAGLDLPVRVGYFYATPSAYGCMDMSGNAYEWVSDWYDAYPGNNDITKDYGQIFRVLRGGSYITEKFEARTSARHFDRMDAERKDYGCRCAMDARE